MIYDRGGARVISERAKQDAVVEVMAAFFEENGVPLDSVVESFADARQGGLLENENNGGVYWPTKTVTVEVVETHDGEECECIDGMERVLTVGDELVLDHVCVDGRVDKVTAKVVRIG